MMLKVTFDNEKKIKNASNWLPIGWSVAYPLPHLRCFYLMGTSVVIQHTTPLPAVFIFSQEVAL